MRRTRWSCCARTASGHAAAEYHRPRPYQPPPKSNSMTMMMIKRVVLRSNRQVREAMRSCTTHRGLPDIAGWPGYSRPHNVATFHLAAPRVGRGESWGVGPAHGGTKDFVPAAVKMKTDERPRPVWARKILPLFW